MRKGESSSIGLKNKKDDIARECIIRRAVLEFTDGINANLGIDKIKKQKKSNRDLITGSSICK